MTTSIFSNRFSLSPGDKARIIRSWWPGVDHARLDDYQTYFDFFHRELKNVPWRNASPKFKAQTLEDLMRVVYILSNNQERPRSAIIAELRKFPPFEGDRDDVPVIRSMELAIRLWLGLNVQTWGIAVPSEMPRISLIQWSGETSPVSMTKEAFPKNDGPNKQRSRISPGFTAWRLVYLCGITIDWTHSLSDHLRFDHGSKILMIYQHKICLLGHWSDTSPYIETQQDDSGSKRYENTRGGHRSKSSVDLEAAAGKIDEIREVPLEDEGSARKERLHKSIKKPASSDGSSEKDDPADKSVKWNPLPRDLLEETMRTLDLLFPFTGDEDTRIYLKRERQTFNQIRTPEGLGPPRALDFSEFKYWRDRLEDIHDVFTSPPRTNIQLWRDRRNRKDFWALIISISALLLAVILGVIGLVNAVRSNDQAKKSYELAKGSFNLALAQGCARQDVVQSICLSLPKRELS